jgi:hypothetical protein
MSRFKVGIGAIIFLLGILFIIFGEIGTVSWCIYDLIGLIKSDSVSFWECVWLVFVRVLGGVCVGFAGVVLMFVGLITAGVTK